MTWRTGITINGTRSSAATSQHLVGFRHVLSSMAPGNVETIALWHYPEDESIAQQNADSYLQCGGRADRMVIELRESTDDGEYRHWVLGRAPITGAPTETIAFFRISQQVHPEEVWTAQQAAALFDHYATQRNIPGWPHRRVLFSSFADRFRPGRGVD